ncbi:hypothetical protein C8J57DRAFT_1534350 [Mycena rebaudengoi]|nr:hypothetical protein C8J57DRAFT_1534350 [Mycena rebaudengoi]
MASTGEEQAEVGSTVQNPLVVGSSPLRPRKPGLDNRSRPTCNIPVRSTRIARRAATTVTAAAGASLARAVGPRTPWPAFNPPSAIRTWDEIGYDTRGAATRDCNARYDDARVPAPLLCAPVPSTPRREPTPMIPLPVPPPPSRAATRIRAHADPARYDGWRAEQETELTTEKLLLDDVAPPVKTTNQDHQRCGICLHLKSYPVLYVSLRHSHCYICIRVWLEHEWTCPTCRTTMYSPLFRNYEMEEGIRLDHPDWRDNSIVNYSFKGLRFPKPRMIVLDHPWL